MLTFLSFGWYNFCFGGLWSFSFSLSSLFMYCYNFIPLVEKGKKESRKCLVLCFSLFLISFSLSFQVLLLLNYNEQEWWGCVLQTPKRPPLSKSLSTGSLDNLEDNQDANKSCPSDIVKKAAMVVFCDFVVGMGHRRFPGFPIVQWSNLFPDNKSMGNHAYHVRKGDSHQGQSQMRGDLEKIVRWG